jgi:hypothetical protein
MNKEEQKRRDTATHDLKAREIAEFEATLPASKADIKDLFAYLDTDQPCDHTLQGALKFIRTRGLPEEMMVVWLQKNGGFCDCEFIFNVEDIWNQMAEEEWQRFITDEEM